MGEDHFLNLQPGTIVNGRYEVVKCLGMGSMGMVYACRHRELAGHLVAMKVLFAEVARDTVAAQRFRNEIVASYGVSHPNVVRAYEYFRDGDLVAFTMEYIGGGDLADRIGGEDLLSLNDVVRMLSQMCHGVHAIHQAGIVHRDLKPENILITAQGDIKITDFGIARTGTGPKLTEHGGVVGTIDYVSPEYLESGQVDARSDIYALGVLAYEIVAGQTPFRGKTVIETMTLRLRSEPPSPRELRKECPVELDRIIRRALARDPAQRYQTSLEMLHDLQALSPGVAENVPDLDAETVASVPESIPMPALRTPIEAPVEQLNNSREEATTTHSLGAQAVGSSSASYDNIESVSYEPSKIVSNRYTQHKSPAAYQFPQERPAMSVSIGEAHLSESRVKELSSNMYAGGDSYIKTVVYWVLVVLVGFGLGIFGLRYYEPELFGLPSRKVVPSYLGME